MTANTNKGFTANARGQGIGLRILVVEDGSDCANSTAILLSLDGHYVEIARNGEIALEMATARMFDAILLDIGLPLINGWEVARQLNEHPWKQRPFLIAVSGFGRDEDRQRSAEVGIDLHLTKPVEPEALETVLRRLQDFIAPDSARE